MTLGQRIQAERKRLGLSQEGLGEALGVTRQAISKWEADGAVPEVDKLVALSRLFHLPVGVLLGVEEAAAAEPPRPVPRWKRRLWPLLSAALGAVCVVLVLRVNTLQSGQAGRLLAAALADGRMWQVEERGVAALGEDGTFCWRLRAVPEVEAPGLGLSVTAEGGGERFTARADRDGLAYEAELRLPLGEEYHFTLRTRTPSGAEYRQELGEWTVTAEALAPLELTARKGKGGTLSGGIWTWDGSIWAACVPPEGSLVTVERAVLRQYRNGAPEWEQSLPVEHGRLEADVSDFQRQTRVEAGDEAPAGGGGGQSGPDLYPPSGGGGLFRWPLRPGVGGVPMTGHKKEPPRTRGGSFLLIPWACPRGRTPCRRRWGAGARRRSGGWGRRRALPGARPFLSRPGRGSCPPGQGRGPPE